MAARSLITEKIVNKKQCPGGDTQSSPGDKIKSSTLHKSTPKRLDSMGGSAKRGKQG